MSVTVSKNELKQVLNKLDSVRLELRLRAMLLPEEEINEKEELKKARKQITKGSGINLDKLIKELS